jgi:hypothetical protein
MLSHEFDKENGILYLTPQGPLEKGDSREAFRERESAAFQDWRSRQGRQLDKRGC